MKRKHPLGGLRAIALLVAATLAQPVAGQAEKFKSAEVTRVVNEVSLLTGTSSSRPASPGAAVSGSTAVRTGQKSRAELQFPDESLVRLGSNSVFSFLEGNREVDLERGTLLMQVPKSLGRTRVKTAAISAAITGTTILIEFVPAVLDENGKVIRPGMIKIIVVEGSLEFALNIAPRKTMELLAGEMIAMRTDAKRLPKKFRIDLGQLIKTSALMDGGMGPVKDLQIIAEAVAEQDTKKREGLLLLGKSSRSDRGGILSRVLGGGPIDRVRTVLNGRPPATPPPLPPTPPGGGNNNPGPPPPPPPSTGGGIRLPDRPDRDPPGGGSVNTNPP